MCQETDSFTKSIKINFGTLNSRCCKENYQGKTAAKGALAYAMDILGLSETHMTGNGLEEIQASKYYKQTDNAAVRSYLDRTISKVANKTILVYISDFNAKTGSGQRDFKKKMGKCGKGHINSSSRCLLEMIARHDPVLTNTLFKHKLAHKTTWTAHEKQNNKNS